MSVGSETSQEPLLLEPTRLMDRWIDAQKRREHKEHDHKLLHVHAHAHPAVPRPPRKRKAACTHQLEAAGLVTAALRQPRVRGVAEAVLLCTLLVIRLLARRARHAERRDCNLFADGQARGLEAGRGEGGGTKGKRKGKAIPKRGEERRTERAETERRGVE